MRKKNLILSLVVLIAVLFFGAVVYPQGYTTLTGQQWPETLQKDFKLGLDLQGGTHLVYEADMSDVPEAERSEAIEGVRDVIERRVNAFGVAEPLVQVNRTGSNWRLIVELAGINDVHEAINLIGETPLLEFKEINTDPPRELTEEEQTTLETFNTAALSRAETTLSRVQENPAVFDEIFDNLSQPNIVFNEAGEAQIEINNPDEGIADDLGFITNQAPNEDLFFALEETPAGQIADGIVTTQDGYSVARVNEIKEGGIEKNVSHILVCYSGTARCESDRTKEDALNRANALKEQANNENFADVARENSDDLGSASLGGELGWVNEDTSFVQEFKDAALNAAKGEIIGPIESEFGYHIIRIEDERTIKSIDVDRLLYIKKTENDVLPSQEQWKNTELSGKDLKRAIVDFDQTTGAPYISLEFNEQGTEAFKSITERNLQKPLAIFLDGLSIIDTNGDSIIDQNDVYDPVIQNVITNGQAVISGSLSLDTAKVIAKRLNAGALPVKISLINQQTVGASLGAQSVQKSLTAGMWGILLVILFMILYYRLPGIAAVVSLISYAVFVLLLFKLFGITLTLAGIAGFILSIGMAVDANVLIFERIREELRNGKPLYSSITDGYRRAWPSIRDGNISTLITCFILAWFGTSIIQGFAITLGLGIIVSMLSAIVFTRIFMYAISPKHINRCQWLYTTLRKK